MGLGVGGLGCGVWGVGSGVIDSRKYIGCLKFQVSFRKRATNYRTFLRQMTFKDKASHGCLSPYR